MKLRAKKGQGAIQLDEAGEFSKGLICLTGGDEGLLAHAFRRGSLKTAAAFLAQLSGIFGKTNLYVELQRHFRREEESRNSGPFTGFGRHRI